MGPTRPECNFRRNAVRASYGHAMEPSKGVQAVMGLAGLVVLSLIIGTFLSGGSTTNSTTSTPPANTSTNTQAPTAPSPAAQVGLWYQQYGSIFTTLGNDLNNVSAASGGSDINAAQSACQTLAADIQTAQSYPAIPDAQTAADWSTVLSDEGSAATDCVNGIQNNDPSLVTQGATEMVQGNVALDKAIMDVQSLTGTG